MLKHKGLIFIHRIEIEKNENETFPEFISS